MLLKEDSLIKSEKNLLRNKFKKIRENISVLRKKSIRNSILKIADLKYLKILSFASFFNEINLWELNEILSNQKRLLLPKIKGISLDIYEVTDIKTQLTENNFNILEPNSSKCKKIHLSKISCILIPGLAFDKNLNRLGFGKGFYDTFLKEIKIQETLLKIPLIGIGYKEQLSKDLLPIENHDVKLDKLLLF